MVILDYVITCDEPDCGKKRYALGLCSAHYAAARRKGKTSDRRCEVEGCDRTYVSSGYCGAHYRRLREWGDVRADLPIRNREPGRVCEYEGCDRPLRASGLCDTHYQRRRNGRAMDAPIKERRKHSGAHCMRPGCTSSPARQGHCLPHHSRHLSLTHKYGLTWEQYDEMYEDQEGKCGICGNSLLFDSSEIAVDHCHQTGAIRGLLCYGCNLGLGAFRDNPDALRAAIAYLERTES